MEDLCSFCNTETLPQLPRPRSRTPSSRPFTRSPTAMAGRAVRSSSSYSAPGPGHTHPAAHFPGTGDLAKDYVDGLTATRYRGPTKGKDAQAGLNLWVGRFAGACQRAVRDATLFEERIQLIQSGMAHTAGECPRQLRRRSAHQVDRWSASPHRRRRRRAGRAQLPADQRSHRATRISRDPVPVHRGPEEPRLRSPRDSHCFHRPRTPARQPGRRHPHLGARTPRPTPKASINSGLHDKPK